jgi:hypothetical protein
MVEPGCGIDIEPWCNNELKIDNIRIENCYIHDNNPCRDFCVEANLQYLKQTRNPEHAPKNNIIVECCKIGKLYILWANTVKFKKCEIDCINSFNFGHKVKMEKCRVGNLSKFRLTKGLSTKNCKE